MNRTILPVIALGAASLCAVLSATADDSAAADNVSVLVHTTTVTRGTLPRTLVAFGAAQPDPAARLAVMAPVAARLAAVYVRVGERVAKGAPLVTLAPTPTTAAAYEAAVSAERVARDALVRTRQLQAQQLATEPQVAAADKAESDARAALAALSAQGAAGPVVVRAADVAIVTAVTATAGAIVVGGAPLIELARRTGLELVAGVTPADAPLVKTGEDAAVMPVGAHAPVPGHVSMRGAAVDSASGLVPVEIALPAGALLPGESAQALITTARVSGFVVPHEAVLVNDAGNTYVVQVERGVAKTVTVRVLVAGGERDVVDGPLDASAPLILAGAYQLQDGMKVRVGPIAQQDAR